jgi:hypothetical protein
VANQNGFATNNILAFSRLQNQTQISDAVNHPVITPRLSGSTYLIFMISLFSLDKYPVTWVRSMNLTSPQIRESRSHHQNEMHFESP